MRRNLLGTFDKHECFTERRLCQQKSCQWQVVMCVDMSLSSVVKDTLNGMVFWVTGNYVYLKLLTINISLQHLHVHVHKLLCVYCAMWSTETVYFQSKVIIIFYCIKFVSMRGSSIVLWLLARGTEIKKYVFGVHWTMRAENSHQ